MSSPTRLPNSRPASDSFRRARLKQQVTPAPEDPAGRDESDQLAIEIEQPKLLEDRPPQADPEEPRAPDARQVALKSEPKKQAKCWVIDPSGSGHHRWCMVVSLAFLYNIWALSYRFAFREIDRETVGLWFPLDYLADAVYALDIFLNFRTGYLEDGVLQSDILKIRHHYTECTSFYLDFLCLLPLDILYITFGFNSILRCTRLAKIYKFWSYIDRTERHTNWPNLFRTFVLVHHILVIFHWNACLFHMISKNKILDFEHLYEISDNQCDDILCQYLQAFYWSTLTLTIIGDLPRPRAKGEFVYTTLELLFGLFLFASVLGHVANIVTNVSAARKEFQAKLDGVKTFMRMRRVSDELQNKVIRWFDYLWCSQESSDEEKSVACLPDRLKAEIAIHVHLDTLKRVDVFQNTEAGFLCELVLRLKPVLFSPGDYVCRKNEVGHEMYIVSRGILEVVTEGGRQVVATLKAGSYFGEISVLNVGLAGNKRTASVRSVGYSDLFSLKRQDLWDVLKNYPNAEARIRLRAEERLSKLDANSAAGSQRRPICSSARRKHLSGSRRLATGSRRGCSFELRRQGLPDKCLLEPRAEGAPLGSPEAKLAHEQAMLESRRRVESWLPEPKGCALAKDEAQMEEELIYNWSGHKSSVGGCRVLEPQPANCHPDSLQVAGGGLQNGNLANNYHRRRDHSDKHHRSPMGANHSSSLDHQLEPGGWCCAAGYRARAQAAGALQQQQQNKCPPRGANQTSSELPLCWFARPGNGGPLSEGAARTESEPRGQAGRQAAGNQLQLEAERAERRRHRRELSSCGSVISNNSSSNWPSSSLQPELSPSAGAEQDPQCLLGAASERVKRSGQLPGARRRPEPAEEALRPNAPACRLTRANSSRAEQQLARAAQPAALWVPAGPLQQPAASLLQMPAILTSNGQLLQPMLAGATPLSVSMLHLNLLAQQQQQQPHWPQPEVARSLAGAASQSSLATRALGDEFQSPAPEEDGHEPLPAAIPSQPKQGDRWAPLCTPGSSRPPTPKEERAMDAK